jgi:hypothetical protein
MYNKRLLSKIDLGKYNKPNPYSKDIILDPQGQYNHPGVPTRIPSNDITMKGVGYPVLGIANNGQKQMMQPGQDYKFPGAKYVDEYPQMKKGGGLNSKKYTRSLDGVGELFRESALFKKPKSKKKKLFHPNAKNFQDGGEPKRYKTRFNEEYAQQFPKDEWGQYVQEEQSIAVRPSAEQIARLNANASMQNDPRYKQVSESTAVNNIYQGRQPSFIGKDPFQHRREVIKQQRAAVEKAVKNTSNKVKKYYKEYHNSPRYLEMLQKSDPENWSNVDAARRHNLENPITRVYHNQPSDRPSSGGFSMNDTGDITVLPNGLGVRGLLPHEWSHSTDRPHPLVGRRAIPDKDQMWINKHRAKDWFSSPEFARQSAQIKKADLKAKNDPSFQGFLKDQKEWYDYVGEDTETRARLNDIRYQAKQMGIYDPFTEKVTPKTFKKLLNTDFESPSKKGFDALKQLKGVYTDEEILWMLNNISKNQDKGQDATQPQMGKYGRIIKQFAPGGVASPKDLDPEHMKRYLADLRMQENGIRKGYRNGMWYPHASVEGGADTIAYGHKLTPNDSALKRGISEDQALKLQEQDVLRNQATAKKQVDKKYGPGTFDNLPQDSQMLLVDYQYNLGTLSGFPSFVKATVEGDKEKMLAEHKRFGAGKPLTKRNEWTVNVINNMEIPKPYDPMKEVTVPLANVPDATSVVQPVMPEGPTAVELPPQQYQDGGVVELNGYQYVKNPANGTWTFTSGAPVTDTMTMQKLNYGEGKPVGSPVVQEAPGRQKAKENIVAASKNVKPPQPIERNVPRGNVSDATAVVQPFIPKPSFVDQPSLVESLKYPEKLQEEAQRLITSGAARDMGITAKYLSPQNANSANPKTLQQLMIEEMTKQDFQKRLDQSRLNKVNKTWNESSTLGKVGDVTRSFLADPINVAEEAIWGDQYLPDRANILRDTRNPLNAYYRKETGYDNSALNNMVSIINPFSSAADATVYARQGNLLGTAKEFGEGLLKAAVLTRAPGALNALMSRRVGLGALGATDVGTLAGATGVASGTLALPTTAKALYKAGQTGNKEDIRAAVNQAGMNALDFIAPEVIGSKGALSALMKGEKLTPLQQLSRQNILTGSAANNLNDLRLSTPGLNQALEMRRNIRNYSEQSSPPVFASLENDLQSQLMNLMDQRRESDRIAMGLRNEGNKNSPYFQAALDESDRLTQSIDAIHAQMTAERAAALRQSALNNQIPLEDATQIDNVARQYLDPSTVANNAGATAAQNVNQRLTGSIDLRRPTPGVTEYGSNLPAPVRTSQIYSDMTRPGAPPVKFSEATREAIRRRPDRTRMSIEAQLRDANDPIDFINRLRSQYANGNINREVYDELLGGLKDAVKPISYAYEDFDFFKEIAATNPDKAYTGSLISRNEALNELKGIPEESLDNVLRDNYGYGLDDIEFLFNTGAGVSEDAAKIAMNQILDDYNYITKYNIPNPHAPAIDFRSRQTLAPQLRGSGDDLGMLNISKKSLDKIQKTRYSNQPQTTGNISYSNTEVADLPKIINKKAIVNNKEIKEQIDAYEEAYSKIPEGSQNPVHRDIQNKLEDLKATNWLRTEYAQELRAAGLSPNEIEKITIVTSGPNSKSMVDADGNVIGTLNFSPSVSQGKKFSEIASTGVSTRYHGYNLKASGFKNWDEAQDALAKRYLDEELDKITNASDKKNPIVVKSLTKKTKERAAAEVAELQRNNNNRFGEALYRGVHHGIKDTRGGIGTKEHFAQTTLTDPITGMPVSRYRAKDYWGSQMRQRNEQGVAKAGRLYGPQTQSDMQWGNEGPIFVLRKKGGDVPKLLRFTQ